MFAFSHKLWQEILLIQARSWMLSAGTAKISLPLVFHFCESLHARWNLKLNWIPRMLSETSFNVDLHLHVFLSDCFRVSNLTFEVRRRLLTIILFNTFVRALTPTRQEYLIDFSVRAPNLLPLEEAGKLLFDASYKVG